MTGGNQNNRGLESILTPTLTLRFESHCHGAPLRRRVLLSNNPSNLSLPSNDDQPVDGCD